MAVPRTLRLEGIGRSYGAVRALGGVSLALAAGEVHALMGENGAGKSTLIRLLAGLERPDAGRFLLDGAPVALDSPDAAKAAGLRFLHQELHVVPALSVAENMHLAHPVPRRWGLVDWPRLNATAAAALARLGLARIDPRVPMARLGPGDQMLVRIAATLIDEAGPPPWLYVMDEPTAALTGEESERLFAVIGELRAQGAGILYVSHRMAEVLRLAERVSVLRDGGLISSMPIAETGQDRIIHDMTGRAPAELFPPRAGPAAGAPVLEVEGLSAGPLAGVSFALAPGEIVGVAGLAGAGRGALLQALAGALPLGSGSVRLAGQRLGAGGPPAAWAAGIAYVPRERRSEGLMLLQAVSDNVTLPHLWRLSRAGLLVHRRRERAEVAGLAAEVRLKAASPRQACAELSGGNQQKVLFARAIAGAPRVLLLDEPTRGVDVGAKADIYRLIRRQAGAGMAVLIASSDLPELLGLADRILVLKAGRLAHCLPAEGLSEAALLAACYGEGADRACA